MLKRRRSREEVEFDLKSGSKVCRSCGDRKGFDEYYNDKYFPDGKSPICKSCYNLKHHNGRTRRSDADYKLNLETKTKECSCCKERKSFSEFHNNSNIKDGKNSRCKICEKTERKKSNTNKGLETKHRISWIRRKYRIEESLLVEMMDSQRGCCAICKESLTDLTIRDGSYVVDHNHNTGEVRGLLCHYCNTMLGQARDSQLILQKGAEYLNERGSYEQLRL